MSLQASKARNGLNSLLAGKKGLKPPLTASALADQHKCMDIKRKTLTFFTSMWPGFLWLFFVVLHLAFFAEKAPDGFFLEFFDRLVMFSCFLMYPIHSMAPQAYTASVLPFAAQFLFWWMLGVGIQAVVKKIKKT